MLPPPRSLMPSPPPRSHTKLLPLRVSKRIKRPSRSEIEKKRKKKKTKRFVAENQLAGPLDPDQGEEVTCIS